MFAVCVQPEVLYTFDKDDRPDPFEPNDARELQQLAQMPAWFDSFLRAEKMAEARVRDSEYLNCFKQASVLAHNTSASPIELAPVDIVFLNDYRVP